MYDRVLVPTDGSEGSTHAALRAIDLADRYGATVSALHVVNETVRALVGDPGPAEELGERGRRALERVETMADAYGVTITTEVRDGDPVDTILEYADEREVDLIVAGTHGRSGIERRMIGSVTERLVRHASCPVLTVRLPETAVTVEDATAAEELAVDALRNEGHDAEVLGVQRQSHLWIAEAGTTAGDDAGGFLIYIDPVTRKTSVVRRTGA